MSPGPTAGDAVAYRAEAEAAKKAEVAEAPAVAPHLSGPGPPPTAERTASETAPPGSPIADRLAKPAGPGWTTLTPAQAAIKVRYPPLPALCITPPVVTGHVKEPEGPRTRAHSRTGFPFRNTLLPRDKGPPKVPSLAPQIISNTAGPVASHAPPSCTLTLAPRNTIAP